MSYIHIHLLPTLAKGLVERLVCVQAALNSSLFIFLKKKCVRYVYGAIFIVPVDYIWLQK